MKYNLELLKADIQDELVKIERLVEDFRGFRHVYRHSYSFELDWDRERLVAQKLTRAASMLGQQLSGFLAKLTELDSASPGIAP